MQNKEPLLESKKFQKLASLLSFTDLIQLCAELGGCNISVPKRETLAILLRNRQIMNDFSKGMSIIQLVHKYNLSENRVNDIVKVWKRKRYEEKFDKLFVSSTTYG